MPPRTELQTAHDELCQANSELRSALRDVSPGDRRGMLKTVAEHRQKITAAAKRHVELKVAARGGVPGGGRPSGGPSNGGGPSGGESGRPSGESSGESRKTKKQKP